MAWLKKLAAGVGAFLTEWAGHPRRVRGTVMERIGSSDYGRITCRLGAFPFRFSENPNEPVLQLGDTVEFEIKGEKEKGLAAIRVVRVP
jgi:hypothetical protein